MRSALGRILTAAAMIAAPTRGSAQAKRDAQGAWGGKTKGVGRYADVNGIKLYYEIGGTGRPLVLLHGGLRALEMFAGPPKSRLAILPGLTHYTLFNAPALAATVIPFLDEPASNGH